MKQHVLSFRNLSNNWHLEMDVFYLLTHKPDIIATILDHKELLPEPLMRAKKFSMQLSPYNKLRKESPKSRQCVKVKKEEYKVLFQ